MNRYSIKHLEAENVYIVFDEWTKKTLTRTSSSRELAYAFLEGYLSAKAGD